MKINFKGSVLTIIAGTLLMVLQATTGFSQDTTKPTLTITNIKSGMRWSNDVFTVLGKAADNVGVSNVFYSLNNAGWTNAVTANSWTNWSAQIDLIPGTNTIAAYAVDLSGNRSVTNTARLVYYLTEVLTVHTNGTGKISISPAYNGAHLQIGANYSMTAKSSVTGYGLVNWTDASNNIVTNTATLKFTMVSNLSLTANYGDVGKPAIKVISSNTNSNGNLVIHGIASDNVGVSNVFYRVSVGLNYGFLQSATTTNNWTNWTATLTLVPGTSTFYVYAVDTNLNMSGTVVVTIQNPTIATSLSGLEATVTPDGSIPFQIDFGKKTFSQLASKGDTNNVNGLGNYTLTAGTDGVSALLKLKYTAPPSAADDGSQTYLLSFQNRRAANFYTSKMVTTNVIVVTTNLAEIPPVTTNSVLTNIVVTISGSMQFSSVSNLALASVANQFLISAGGDASTAYGTLFQNGKFTTYGLLSASTNIGSFTYSVYSPISALLKLTKTNGTDYIVATYGGTNYGNYHSEQYTPTGVTNGTDAGHFVFASQKPGGNAPLTLTNRNLHIFAGDDDFNAQFGSTTYSQDSATTNFDNAVGAYTYSLATTNVGLLSLTVMDPPPLIGNTSDARLIFVASNAGLFTNEDGTISTFALTSVTNLAPASITNITMSLGYDRNFQFDTNGGFNFTNPYSITYSYSGNYTYTPFSPEGAMIHAIFVTGTNTLGWIQLKFTATNSGNWFWNEFDATTNFLDSVSGQFHLQ